MAREKVYAKKGLFGSTVFVNKEGRAVGKTMPGSKSGLIRDTKGRAVGKSCGSYGVAFSKDKD